MTRLEFQVDINRKLLFHYYFTLEFKTLPQTAVLNVVKKYRYQMDSSSFRTLCIDKYLMIHYRLRQTIHTLYCFVSYLFGKRHSI